MKMKTNDELEAIVDQIRTGYQLRSEVISTHVKLLHAIQIDALREALEVMEKYTRARDGLEDVVGINAKAELERTIRDLEL